jgi:hypothetical protein
MSIWFKVLAACFREECGRVKKGGAHVLRWWKEECVFCNATILEARDDLGFFFLICLKQ